MAKKTVLLIGAGGWGEIHRHAISASRDWVISAVADANQAVLDQAKEQLALDDGALFTDGLKAIEQATYDAIAVVVRNPFRVPLLAKALKQGVPVMTDKPLVHTQSDLNKIYRAIEQSDAPMMVSQNYRFEPQVRRLATFIQEKKTWGELQTISIRFARAIHAWKGHYLHSMLDAKPLGYEMGIHHMDLMRFLTGRNPVSIQARWHRTNSSPMAGWGSLHAWIEFPGNLLVNYTASFDAHQDLTPWGGLWDLNFAKGDLSISPYSHNEVPLKLHSPWKGAWKLVTKEQEKPETFRFHLVDRSYKEFAGALADGRTPECSLSDNVQSLAMMMALEKSAASGRTINFQTFLKKVMEKCPS